MKRSAILVCAFICARIPVAAQINYSFTNIDVPGATQTNPSGVNASGEVAGYYWDGSTDHGFVYINGQFTTFDYPGALLTQALSVADNGDVYGAYALAGSWQAFKYTPNTAQFETLPLPIQLQQNVQIITGVGPTGDVVGHMENPQTGFYGAFLVSNGQLTIVPARSSTSYLGTTAVGVNGSGQVLASSWDLSDAYVYSRGVLTTVPSMNPGGIGPQGQIVGQAKDSPSSGVVFADGVLSTFQAPGSTSASFNQSIRPYGINVSNQIVGTYVDTSGIQHGFLATPPSPVQGETTKGYVDTPNGNSGSLSGIVPVIGWAIDNKAAIADVNILVDNTWVGVAKLGMSRTDVCAAFPNQVNCPNVGWTYQLDTTQLADGPHVITALATSANIAHAIVTTPITVANSGAKARNPLRLWIDVPGPQNSTFSGEATFAGWAGDDTAPVNSITALVDHTATFYGTWVPVSMRQSRPDVCAVYPSAQDCPNPGWSAVVDTTQLANGPHILSITATDSNGISNTLTANFTVANTSPLKIYIDQPNSNSGTLTGTSLFSGWALDPNAKITDVELLIDGSFYYFINGEAYYSGTYVGGYRPDVCVVYPASPDCPNVGWSTQFDTSQLANGSHTMAIRADAGNGDRATTPPVSFNVANGLTSKSTKVWIDQPSNSITQTFWGQAQFAGWALDDMAQISTVMISIDGNPNGISSVTYIQRNDVCAVYPSRPGCPNVGWSVDVDTTALTNGTHTVTATAISANGSQATQSTTFQVSNSLGGDGTRLYIDSPNSQTGDVGGHLTVAGWALSSQYSINNVSLAVDGAPFGSATLGVSRPDVCTVFPSGSDCPNVGWSGTIDTTLLSKGPHKLEVTAQAGYPYSSQALPDQSATASVLFNALNANAANPVSVYIDVPSATGASLSGVTSFAGWAIDINDSISSVEITIDGAPYGTATYGANRPDVCAAFPNDNGCPAANVGWNFAIDTTLLPNGSHTLAVTATSSDGLHETVSKSFKVSN